MFTDFAPVNPFNQQKIVYAKCLTPRNEAVPQPTDVEPDQTLDGEGEAMHHSTISDMFEAARKGDLHALVSQLFMIASLWGLLVNT